MSDKTGILIACTLLLLFSLKLIQEGFYYLAITAKLIKSGNKVKGRVKSIQKKPFNLMNRGEKAPVFEFETEDKTIVEGVPTNCIYSEVTFYKIGDIYELYYDISNPSKFIVAKWTEKIIGISALLFSIGLAALCILGIVRQIE